MHERIKDGSIKNGANGDESTTEVGIGGVGHKKIGVRHLVEKWFLHRRERGVLSKAHDIDHVRSVAQAAKIFAQKLSKRYGVDSERVSYIAEVAGWLHDVVRRKTEKVPHGPYGAKVVERLVRCGIIDLEPWEKDIVMFAVGLHEINYSQAMKIKVSDKPTPLEDTLTLMLSKDIKNINFDEISCTPSQKVVLLSVIIGDKVVEAKGPRVVERRAYFVSGERLHHGDLQYLKEKLGDDAPYYAFISETLVRWFIRNPVSSYPDELQEFVSKLQANVEEEVTFALIMGLGYSPDNLEGLIDKLAHLDFPKFDSQKIKSSLPWLKDRLSSFVNSLPENEKQLVYEDAKKLISYYSESAKDNKTLSELTAKLLSDCHVISFIGNDWVHKISNNKGTDLPFDISSLPENSRDFER